MSPTDPITLDTRPVSQRVLADMLGGVLNLVAGGKTSGFSASELHLLDIADTFDLVDCHVGIGEPDFYVLAPLGQALLKELEPRTSPPRIYVANLNPQELVGIMPCNDFTDWQVMRQGPEGNAEPVGDEFGTIAYVDIFDAVEVLRTGRVWKHDMGDENPEDPDSGPLAPRFDDPDPGCLSTFPEYGLADTQRETWLHQDEATGAILATPVSDQPAEMIRRLEEPAISPHVAAWMQAARDAEANDYLQALRDGEIAPRHTIVTVLPATDDPRELLRRELDRPHEVGLDGVAQGDRIASLQAQVRALDLAQTIPGSSAEAHWMMEGEDWAASAMRAVLTGEPWDADGATRSLRDTLCTLLPVAMARQVAEALRPLALVLGWTEKDEVSGADIQDRLEAWAQERAAYIGQHAQGLVERGFDPGIADDLVIGVDHAAPDGGAMVAALVDVGEDGSTMFMLNAAHMDELALQPGDTLSVEKAATGAGEPPMMGSIPLVDVLRASGLDLSPAGLQRELEEAKARPWIEAPWICKERDSFSGQETWTLPEGAYAMIEQEDGNGVRRDSWRLVLTSPRYTDPQHARNAGNRIAPRFRDACLSGGLTEVEPGIYGTVNGRLQVEQ